MICLWPKTPGEKQIPGSFIFQPQVLKSQVKSSLQFKLSVMGMIRCASALVLFLHVVSHEPVAKPKTKTKPKSRTLSMLADWMSCPLSLILRRKLIMACWYSGLPWANGVGLKVAGSRRPESNPSTIWGENPKKINFYDKDCRKMFGSIYFF